MPLASPGAFTALLAQAPALCGSVPLPATMSPPEVEIVQRDDAFVIISDAEPVPDRTAVPVPVGRAGLKIGRAVQIDPILLGGTPHEMGAPR